MPPSLPLVPSCILPFCLRDVSLSFYSTLEAWVNCHGFPALWHTSGNVKLGRPTVRNKKLAWQWAQLSPMLHSISNSRWKRFCHSVECSFDRPGFTLSFLCGVKITLSITAATLWAPDWGREHGKQMHNGLSSGYVMEYNSEQLCFCNFSFSFLCDVHGTEAHPSILKLCSDEKDSEVENVYDYF